MIINLRGTSGSGKSYLVRSLMARYSTVECEYVPGRKRPIAHVCHRSDGRSLHVVGHYETPCGGADTIQARTDGQNTMDLVYDEVRRGVESGRDVVYEGLVIQNDVNRCVMLSSEYEVVTVVLQVPIEECLDAVRRRRQARGDSRELNPKNTIAMAKSMARQADRLRSGGVDVRVCSRGEAENVCVVLLGLHGDPTMPLILTPSHHDKGPGLF